MVREKKNGYYESVKLYHSWDNNSCISNWLLFRLGRHSDHHCYPIKNYQYLENNTKSPKLITGYPGMTIIALIPPLFFYLMNPIIDDMNKKNKN